jgi:hypothetical protein
VSRRLLFVAAAAAGVAVVLVATWATFAVGYARGRSSALEAPPSVRGGKYDDLFDETDPLELYLERRRAARGQDKSQ